MAKILVTGAGGFVGPHVCRALSERSHDVVAAVRSAKSGSTLQALVPRSVAVGHITRETNWDAALSGCEAVVHLAGRAHVMNEEPARSEQLYEEGNVGVLEGLAEASRKAGIRRFVFVSSIKVNGEETPNAQPFTASEKPNPQDAYGRTKLRAEERLKEIASSGPATNPMDWVIVRPPLVYGPNVRGNIARLMRLIERGVPLPFASIKNARDLLHVGALADLLAIAVTHPKAANRIFLACDGAPLSTPGLIEELALAVNRPARLLPCPPRLLAWTGRLAGMDAEIRRLTGDLRVDDHETRTLLDWRPKQSRREAFKEMVEAQRTMRRAQSPSA